MTIVNQQPEALANLRLSGQAIESSAIPVEVLINTLAAMQQLVYLVASDADSKKLSQRFRVTEEIQRQYRLVCNIPQPGSYVVPLSLESNDSQLNILPDTYTHVFDKLLELFQSVVKGDIGQVKKAFSDSAFAKRALIEIKRLLPRADDSWSVSFEHKKLDKTVTIGRESIRRIDDWFAEESQSESVITITGELIKIDFDERKLYLRYPPNRREIECIYSADLEDLMIESRRQYIQVTGQFTLDANGEPNKLTDVTRIEQLDLSPLILSEISYGGRKFHFTGALQFDLSLDDESKQLLLVDRPDLGINVYARTREGLVDEISQQIAFVWDEFAQAEDVCLTPEARSLKHNVLNSVESDNAA